MDYQIIGVMTGNSMDAVDVVLTVFEGGKMTDKAERSLPYPKELHDDFIALRQMILGTHGANALSMQDLKKMPLFQKTHDAYIRLVAKTVDELIALNGLNRAAVTAIGFHGQTLDHYPPSVAGTSDTVYTLQIGSGQMLADLTGIPVIYDFRSDDMMNGGEGAPLAPMHNKNIAAGLGLSESVFFNAGNTSNIAVVAGDCVLGWDAGPFNEFPDKIVRAVKGQECDFDGRFGLCGQVDMDGVRHLFETAAVTADGRNFLNLVPPKSSDPSWYRMPPEFLSADNFENNLATAEFFGAYAAAYTLKFIPEDIPMPSDFVLFGGGWLNPVCRRAFEDILTGRAPVLPEHEAVFDAIRARFKKPPAFEISRLSKYMEARICADLARYFLDGRPWFAKPLKPGHKSVVLGVCRKPFQEAQNDQINRAAKGWQDKKEL